MKINANSLKTINGPTTAAEKKAGYVMHWDDSLQGFGVRVTSSGAISYIVQGRVNGKNCRKTLGRSNVIPADKARKSAKTQLGQWAAGIDHRVEKKVAKATTTTLLEITDDYIENKKTKKGLPLKQRTKDDIAYHVKGSEKKDGTFTGTGTFSDWQKKPIASITREMVRNRYKQKAGSSVAQANQSMRILSALIRYAQATLRKPDGSKIIADNPVDVLRESRTMAGLTAKTTIVPPEKRGEWWAEVQRQRNDPSLTPASKTAIDFIAFVALTGLRLTEAKTLKWSQVDLDDKSFNLYDTKNRRDVTFPLSDLAHEILAARYAEGANYVFPGKSNGHLDNANKRFKIIGKETGVYVTCHPLRRTFIQIGVKEQKIELWRVKALSNHKQENDVTLESYGDLTDVRFLQNEANQIANYYENKRAEFMSLNVVDFPAVRA